jgi:pectinesterase
MFPDKEKTAYYAEYNNTGPGSALAKRVSWSKQLNRREAKQYTLKNIFSGWIPQQKVNPALPES